MFVVLRPCHARVTFSRCNLHDMTNAINEISEVRAKMCQCCNTCNYMLIDTV